MRKSGFTLIELLAVLMIVGILASIGIPRYTKTVETGKSDEAEAVVQTVYTANRMYKINNPSANYVTGEITAASTLVTRNYIQALTGRQYAYCGANDATASIYAACARRSGGTGQYANWSHRISAAGVLTSCEDMACAAVCACP